MILPSLTFPGFALGEPFKEVLLMATIQLGEPKLGDTRDVAETFEGENVQVMVVQNVGKFKTFESLVNCI